MPKIDINPFLYYVWAIICLVIGLLGVLLSWRLGPAGFPSMWVTGCKVVTIVLLVAAGFLFIQAFSS